MPRPSCITAELVREVQHRRAAGEAWKRIAADLRRRGLPAGRTTWHRFLADDVPEHLSSCANRAEPCTA